MNNSRGVAPLPNSLERRALAQKERRERRWIRDNYRLYQSIDPMWSIAMQDEARKINQEAGSITRANDED